MAFAHRQRGMVDDTTTIGGCNAVGGSSLLSLSYPRDANGQVTAENATAYGYDALNRLSSAGGAAYTIDKADQITQQPYPQATTTTFTYDAANQLKTGAVAAGPAYTYTYDGAGNRHTRVDGAGNTQTYNYDQLNRMTSFVPEGPAPPTHSYTYNGDGLRMFYSFNGVQNDAFAWDVAEGLPLLLWDGTTAYLSGPGGLPVEQVSGSGTLYFYQPDQLGSTRLLTDATGAVAESYTYDAYGNASVTGTVGNVFQFAGQFTDSETGFYYLRARYYDPATGQFTSSDPVKRLTREPYPYVRDNPLNRRDPSGLCEQSGGPNVGLCALGLSIAAIGVVGGVALLGSGVGEFVAAASPEIPFIESVGGWIASVSGAKLGLAVVGAGIAGATGLIAQNCPPLLVDAS